MNQPIRKPRMIAPEIIKDSSFHKSACMKGGARDAGGQMGLKGGPSYSRQDVEMKGVKPKEIGELLHEIYEFDGERKAGKDHKRYQIQRAVSLGMKIPKEKIPLKIRMGMIQKHHKRMNKALEQEKELGLFDERRGVKVSLPRLTEKVLDKRSPMSTSCLVARTDLAQKKKRVMRERGLNIETGKFKNGTLHISRDEIRGLKASNKGKGPVKKHGK